MLERDCLLNVSPAAPPALPIIVSPYIRGGKKNIPAEGSIVYYEIPGQISLPKLRENGLDMDALCRHYVYITEYLWRVRDFAEMDIIN